MVAVYINYMRNSHQVLPLALLILKAIRKWVGPSLGPTLPRNQANVAGCQSVNANRQKPQQSCHVRVLVRRGRNPSSVAFARAVVLYV